ncbi:vacuolar membrane-associated protein iml1 [Puccinia graminis f. sp. tritici]|uniref:Vacuolar membrane-associated protein IML1 n=1 Tax=Puccinia graminis f. sp. tritici TaxID=56615 RepID=A0A5B0R033_PUCGR|nr:vacuolar membrane-associated protein iml1 [Puccinia graminis f. sp. tritici]
MPPLAAECFRVTLWVDPEPPCLATAGQVGLDTSDAANAIRLNPGALEPASVSIGDLFEIVPLVSQVSSIPEASLVTAPRWQHEPGFMLAIRHHTLVRQQGLQLSIPIAIAKAFDLEKLNRHEVLLRKLPAPLPSTHCADHVELSFRDQYLGRGEMWRMTMMMVDSCAWVGREVTLGTLKVKTKVGRIYVKGRRVLSGYITPHTKLIFRSESAKYYIFIQISAEMWTFEEDGSLYHEKAILFLEELFSRWAGIGTSHLVSLILFSRVFYSDQEKDQVPPPLLVSGDGRTYKDFYKVVADLEPLTRPQKVLDEVRDEISKFQKHVLTYTGPNGIRRLAGKLSYAPEGNVLEAMGIACNSFDEHYIDRDLRRTGVSIVFVTAGTCVYHVDQMLLRLATERFIAHGVGVDFVSLAKIPLHVVPLFRFSAADLEPNGMPHQTSSWTIDNSLNPIYIDSPSPHAQKSIHYSVPFFVDCSFFSRHQDRPFRIDRFMPRCRLPQFQNGIGEHDLTGISIPLLSESMPQSAISDDAAARKKARQRFDAQVVDASPTPLAPLRATGINQRSGSRAMVDGLAVTAVETKRKFSTSKHEEINRSPLLKATLPQGATDFSHLTNQPSAGLSIVPISSSETSRARATSASTSGSNNPKAGTPALIARLTNLSQQHRSFWPWSTSSSSSATIKVEPTLQAATINPPPSPPEGSRTSRNDETNLPTASEEPPPSTAVQDGSANGTRVGRSDTLRSATTLMPFINAPRRTVSASSNQQDTTPISSRAPSIAPQKLKHRLVVKKFNPSNPYCSASGLLSQFKKWSAIFPRPPNNQRSLKWKSLTTPACLPITTDFAPNQDELDNSYLLTEYEFPIGDSSILVKCSNATFSAEESVRNHAASVLREAISQRLSQSFQLVVPQLPQHVADLSPSSRPSRLSLKGIIKEAEKGQGAYVDLSLSDHYHRLSIRRLESGKPTLSVQIYVRHQTWKTESYTYRPAIWWSNERPGWDEFSIPFNFPLRDFFDFEALDKIIVGIDNGIPLNDGLKYCRLRAAFLPSLANVTGDSVLKPQGKALPSDDENRLAGMMKLQSTLRNVNWHSIGDSAMSGPTLDFTTSDASQHVRHERDRSLAFATPTRDPRDKSSHTITLRDPLNVIIEAMLHPASGVEVKSQLVQLRLMENVFQGDKLVTFLKHQLSLGTREEALNFGRQLETRGMFKEVTNGNQPRALIDGNRYYQINSEYRPMKPPRTWFGRPTTDKLLTSSSNPKPTSNPVIGPSAEESKRSSSVSGTQLERTVANMTRVGIIDLDPTGKSDRSEKAILLCDISHSPSNAWHVEIQWLGITSSLVDSMLQHWARIVERYGIKMVEQTSRRLDQVSDSNPLQRTTRIELAVKPPTLDGLEELIPISTSPNWYFEGQLMRSQGFVLDVEADRNFPSDVNVVYSYRRHSLDYSQYIHHTGAASVQVQDGCLVWSDNLPARISNNRRFIGGRGEPNSSGIDAKQLRSSLIRLCNDTARLKQFWEDCVENLHKTRDPAE